jgi:hypothetical protein
MVPTPRKAYLAFSVAVPLWAFAAHLLGSNVRAEINGSG